MLSNTPLCGGRQSMTSTASSRFVETSLRLVTLASIAGLLFSDAHAATPPFTKNSAQFSSYRPEGEYPSPPSRCKVNQVIALQRNGASGPGAELATSIQDTLAKIVGKSEYSRSEMRFLSNYTYKLGASGALLAHGTTQSKESGVQFRKTYCGTGTISEKDCANVWVASTSSRSKVDSAKAWGSGFMQGTGTSSPSPRIIEEGAHNNNTLAANCPNLVSSVPTAQQQWRDVWTPAVLQRLQGGTNYGLNSTDIVNFAYMCALESLATTELSPFCGLFLDTEWSYVEYDGDLGKYYNHAYGAPLARSQGVGYANELLTRLSGLLAFYAQRDQTQVNNTADADPSKFPLDRSVYIDFTSDDQLLAVMTLLGLFQDAALSTTAPCPMRSFVISQIVPFAGQMVVERLTCSGNGFWRDLKSKITSSPVQFMRLLVNDRAMDLTHICDQDNVSEKGTLCETYGFLYGIEKLAKAGTQEFAKCGFVPADLWAKPKSKGAQVVAVPY